MITTKIQIEPYLAEYVVGKYYNSALKCVLFPPFSDIYITIYDLTQKKLSAPGIDVGNLEFALPDRREANFSGGKKPEHYRYISQRGAKIIERRIRTMFWAEVHDTMDENKHKYGIDYAETAYMILRRYDIHSIQEDGIIKNYQRWRAKIRSKRKKIII